MLVHVIEGVDRTSQEKSKWIKDNIHLWGNITGSSYISTSMISENNLSTASTIAEYALGFLDVEPEKILIVNHSDAQVIHETQQKENAENYDVTNIRANNVPTGSDNIYKDAEELNQKTLSNTHTRHYYNEIVLARNSIDSITRPNALICFKEEITEEMIGISKKLNVPIIKIDVELYKQQLLNNAEDLCNRLENGEEISQNEYDIMIGALSRSDTWNGIYCKEIETKRGEKLENKLKEIYNEYKKKLHIEEEKKQEVKLQNEKEEIPKEQEEPETKSELENKEMAMIEYKTSIFQRIKNFIISKFERKNQKVQEIRIEQQPKRERMTSFASLENYGMTKEEYEKQVEEIYKQRNEQKGNESKTEDLDK